MINVAHLATFAADCTEASQNYYQQGINFAADLQFLVNAVESTVTSLDEVSDHPSTDNYSESPDSSVSSLSGRRQTPDTIFRKIRTKTRHEEDTDSAVRRSLVQTETKYETFHQTISLCQKFMQKSDPMGHFDDFC